MKKSLIYFLFAFLLTSCNHSGKKIEEHSLTSESYTWSSDSVTSENVAANVADASVKFEPPVSSGEYNESSEPTDDHSLPEVNTPQATEKKIIKNADLRIKVDKLSESRKRITELLKKYKAYISEDNTENEAGSSTTNVNLTIRVDYRHFDSFMSEIMKEATFVGYNRISVQDVTAQYVDVEARLQSKRTVLKRFQEILVQAKTVSDILKVEHEIRILQEEIDAREGEMKLLKDQVQYSTIHLEMYQEQPYRPEEGQAFSFAHRIGNALATGWNSIVDGIVFLICNWPWWIVAAAIFFFIRWRVRRNREKEATGLK